MERLDRLPKTDTITFYLTTFLLLVTAGETGLKPSLTTIFLLLLLRLVVDVGVGLLFLPTGLSLVLSY
jgi:hypothetical protein